MAEGQFVEGYRARAGTVAAENFPGELRECIVKVLRRLHYQNPLCGSVYSRSWCERLTPKHPFEAPQHNHGTHCDSRGTGKPAVALFRWSRQHCPIDEVFFENVRVPAANLL